MWVLTAALNVWASFQNAAFQPAALVSRFRHQRLVLFFPVNFNWLRICCNGERTFDVVFSRTSSQFAQFVVSIFEYCCNYSFIYYESTQQTCMRDYDRAVEKSMYSVHVNKNSRNNKNNKKWETLKHKIHEEYLILGKSHHTYLKRDRDWTIFRVQISFFRHINFSPRRISFHWLIDWLIELWFHVPLDTK